MFDSLSIIINKNSTIIEGNYYRKQYWELVEDGELMIWKGQSNMFFWGKDLIVLSCSIFTNAAVMRTFSSTQNVLQQYTADSSHFLIIGKIDINTIPQGSLNWPH